MNYKLYSFFHEFRNGSEPPKSTSVLGRPQVANRYFDPSRRRCFFGVPQLQELAYFNENLRNFVLLTTFGLKLLAFHVVTKYLHPFPDNFEQL